MQRLDAVLSLIDKCGVLADIGCDHGKISLKVLQNSLANTVYAADISEKSLKKAKELLKVYPSAHCIVSDGFLSLPTTPDTAVITGMGGREIVKIITGQTVQTLILGPQNQVGELRIALITSGYEIVRDFVVIENKKFYDIIKAVYTGKTGKLAKNQFYYGMFYKDKSESLLAKILLDEKKLLAFKQTAENIEKLDALYEVKKWQQ